MILIKPDQTFKHITDEEARALYLDYVNNFLTIAKFAEYYNITYFSAQTLITKLRGV